MEVDCLTESTRSTDVSLVEGVYRTVQCLHAPFPESPSSQPPPSQRWESDKVHRHKGLDERSSVYKERKEEFQKKEKKSFLEKAQAKLDSVSHKMDKLTTEASQSAHDKYIEKMTTDAEERFKKHFSTLALTEKLVYHDYYCTLVNEVTKDAQQHKMIEGYMAATEKSFLFIAAGSGHDPTFRVDLRDIVSVRKAVKMETLDLNPHCMPLPTPRVVAQGVMIYTRQGHVHRFFDFKPSVGMASSSTNITENAFGILDYAWRAANPVIPLPDHLYDNATGPK